LLALAVLALVQRLVIKLERLLRPPADDKPRVFAAPDDETKR
jgi:hypothetical protein